MALAVPRREAVRDHLAGLVGASDEVAGWVEAQREIVVDAAVVSTRPAAV